MLERKIFANLKQNLAESICFIIYVFLETQYSFLLRFSTAEAPGRCYSCIHMLNYIFIHVSVCNRVVHTYQFSQMLSLFMLRCINLF